MLLSFVAGVFLTPLGRITLIRVFLMRREAATCSTGITWIGESGLCSRIHVIVDPGRKSAAFVISKLFRKILIFFITSPLNWGA